MAHDGETLVWRGVTDERRLLLVTQPATPGEKRLALTVLALSAAIFLALIPFAKVQLAPVPAFIPIYQSALAVNDLITAALLFSQFSFTRMRGLLALCAGYLFTALMAAAHALTFPGLFAPAGLLGAGPQSTAWMFMFWHAGFPLLVMAYALARREAPPAERAGSPAFAIAATCAAALAAAVAFTALATAGHSLLPAIMAGNRYTAAMIFVVGGTWAFSFVALGLLWRRRPHTKIDLWLMVVLAAWLFDIGLAAVFNGGRYDLGFYSGRVYGLLAASFVLVVLLAENYVLYGRLMAAHESEQRERQRAEKKSAELASANKELDSFSYSVSHDLRAPLRAIDGYARMLEEEVGERLEEEPRRLLGIVRANARKMGQLIEDLLRFARLGQRSPSLVQLDMGAMARDVAAELTRESPAARVVVGELPPALGDPALFRQVWLNLVANALKYSAKQPEPSIEIGGRADAEESVYWVRDNGAGFDMRYASRLFGVFQRLHHESEFPGTGIGLAIVQRVVSRHGGRAWAEGRPGEGACFYFALPRSPEGVRSHVPDTAV